MQENEMIAVVLVNVDRAEHHLPPCALTDLTDTDLNRYLARAIAVQTAIRAAVPSIVSGSDERAREVEQAAQRIQMWMDDEHRTLSPGEVGAELAYDDVTTVVRAALAASRPTDAGAIGGGIVLYGRGGYAVRPDGEPFPPTADAYTFYPIPNAVIAALATPKPPVDEVITGERLFRTFMAGDTNTLTGTALPTDWPMMKPSVHKAWNDLARNLTGDGAQDTSKGTNNDN